MTIQNYDIQIPAGGTQLLEVSAQIFDFVSSGSAFDVIQVLPEFQQGNVSLKLGQGFDAGKVVNRWFVKNPGTTAINGTVVLSTAGFRNFRISGDVNVLDGGKSRTLAGSAFTCLTNLAAAAPAGNYPRLQLWNPAGSGKRLVVESLSLVVPTGGGYSTSTNVVWMNTMALTSAPTQPQSKNPAVGVAVAQIQSDTPNTIASFASDVLYQLDANSSSVFPFVPKEPLIVPPGWGLTCGGPTAATNLAIGFEWYEEPNT